MRTLFVKKRSSFIIVLFLTIVSISLHHIWIDRDLPPPSPPVDTTPRICCAILTSPDNLLTRAKAVHETWAPRCDHHYFITELPRATMKKEQLTYAEQLPIPSLQNLTGGYRHLTEKTRLGFMFAHEHLVNACDWFVKADDDTYLVLDNLKAFLREQNKSEPVTFGYNLKVFVSKGYHSGGASYVLSREALRRFYHAQFSGQKNCLKDGGPEDVEINKCLRSQGVYPGRSLDQYNREIFHPLPFIQHFIGRFPKWLQSYAENPLRTGFNCCSDHSVSFHYVNPENQYLMDYLLYKVRPRPASRPISLKVKNKV